MLTRRMAGKRGVGSSRALDHHHAELGDVRLHYVTAGSGFAVVLLHGWPQSWYEWRLIMPGLAERFRVIAPDLRGLGDSSRPAGGHDKKTVGGDIWPLIHGVLGISEFHLVGHDWGGPTAYAIAVAHPSRSNTSHCMYSSAKRRPRSSWHAGPGKREA